MPSLRYIIIIVSFILAGNLFGQESQKGVRGILAGHNDEIRTTREDFIYDMELLPGQEYSGYIYHWSDWGGADGDLYEDPEVNWLEVSPSIFTATGCDKPVPVRFTFRAPPETGVYTTTVIDDEWNWPDNKITLTVTRNPSYKTSDSTIIVEGPGSRVYRYEYHEYHGIDPTQSWWDDGYCGEDPYVFNPTRKIIHTIFPHRPNVTIQPNSFTLLLDRDTIVNKIFQVAENKVDSFYEMISTQWRSYPEYIKWKLVPADSYCLGWEQIPTLNVPSVQSGTEVFDDLIYLAGGREPFTHEVLDRVEIFDGKSWTVSAASLNEPRHSFAHALLDNRIYIFGGSDENHHPTSTVQYYSGGFWNLSPDTMPGSLTGHSGSAYANNFYVFGGRTEEGYLDAAWRYSLQNGWSVISDSLPFSSREGYQCIRMARYIYILGGMFSEDRSDTVFFTDVYRYDPVTGFFSQASSMNRARADFACGVVDGLLYVAGGISDNAFTSSSVEFYDPATEKWLTCNDTPDLTIIPAGYTVKDDHLFLLGGTLTQPNTTVTYRTCFGSGYITGEEQEPEEDPGPELQAFPNPMRDVAVFIFELPYDSKVTFQLFDLRGRLVKTIVDEHLVADKYQFQINGRLFAEGLYLGRLQTERHKMVQKIVKVKHYN